MQKAGWCLGPSCRMWCPRAKCARVLMSKKRRCVLLHWFSFKKLLGFFVMAQFSYNLFTIYTFMQHLLMLHLSFGCLHPLDAQPRLHATGSDCLFLWLKLLFLSRCSFLVSGNLALLRADLQFRRYHGPNAGRRPQIWNRRHLLEGHNDGGGQGHSLPGGNRPAWHAQSVARGQLAAGRHPEGPQPVPGEETTLLSKVWLVVSYVSCNQVSK